MCAWPIMSSRPHIWVIHQRSPKKTFKQKTQMKGKLTRMGMAHDLDLLVHALVICCYLNSNSACWRCPNCASFSIVSLQLLRSKSATFATNAECEFLCRQKRLCRFSIADTNKMHYLLSSRTRDWRMWRENCKIWALVRRYHRDSMELQQNQGLLFTLSNVHVFHIWSTLWVSMSKLFRWALPWVSK